MDINFELYKIFFHAASLGSFSKAAGKLYITQSAVSQAIQNLEKKTGSKLFYRESRSIRLTPEGELLFRHVEQAYNFIKAGESKLDQLRNLEAGEIRIGIGDTLLKYFLIPHLRTFIQKYPHIKIRVVNRTSRQIISALKNGMVDLGIVTLPVEDHRVKITEYMTVHDIFVANERFSCLKDRPVPLEELARYPILMLEKESSTRKLIDLFLQQNGIRLIPEIELESVDLLVEFARIGVGVAHVLKESAKIAMENGELFEIMIGLTLPERRLGIITMKEIPLSSAVAEFIRHI